MSCIVGSEEEIYPGHASYFHRLVVGLKLRWQQNCCVLKCL